LEVFKSSVRETFQEKVLVLSIGSGRRRVIVVVCRAGEYQKLSPLLYRYGVELIEVPETTGTPALIASKLRAKILELERKKQVLESNIQRLSRKYAEEVSRMKELLEIQKERLEASGLFGFTASTVVLEGWTLERDISGFQRTVSRITRGRHIMLTSDPTSEEMERVPIELKNPKVVKDFEFLTGMYGLPRYDEIDPTTFLAVTFPLFFGMCLSDAGYGLVLAAFMLSGVWIAKIFPPYLRRMIALCGIITTVVSLFIGGWFGFGGGAWVNPIEQPIPLLKLVIFIGIAHLIIAFVLAGVLKDLVRRDWKKIIFDRISRAMILFGFFGLSFCVLGIGLHEFGVAYNFPRMDLFTVFNPLAAGTTVVQVFRALFYGGLIVGATGAVLMSQGVRGKIGGPINVVYGITGLIADVTSYTRLLALGIATGVIAFSINFIISIFWGWMVSPYLSFSPSIIVAVISAGMLAFLFVAAHSFNIFINTLGGFIHTMRLHFAEFFGKFYEGGGEKFNPFKAKRRVTIVKGGAGFGR